MTAVIGLLCTPLGQLMRRAPDERTSAIRITFGIADYVIRYTDRLARSQCAAATHAAADQPPPHPVAAKDDEIGVHATRNLFYSRDCDVQAATRTDVLK